MPRILIVSPHFPPSGVSGAKRALHLARHLPAEGFEVVVLAAPPRGPLDPALEAALPAGVVVDRGLSAQPAHKKTKTESSAYLRASASRTPARWRYLTPFDRTLLDLPAGARALRRLLAEHRPDLVHFIADPWAPLLLAPTVRDRPVVVDLRDPWSLHAGKMALRPAPTRTLLRATEAWIFRHAARVVLNTEAACRAYRAAYAGHLPPEHFTAIRNAFDRALFAPGPPAAPATLTYFGHFRRFVEPDPLFAGFARFLAEHGPGTLRIVGGLEPHHRERARFFGIEPHLEVVPAVPLSASLPLLAASEVLALVVQPASHLQLPGKLYDYLAAGRPILAASANPELDALLAASGAGQSVPLDAPGAFAQALATLRRQTPTADVEAFSAATQARQVAEMYRTALARKAGR